MTTWDGLTTDDVRSAVREVLRDVLPDLARAAGSALTPAGFTSGASGAVVVRDDADLDRLVRHVAQLCGDPSTRTALLEGRHDLRLQPTGSSTVAVPGSAAEPGPIVERLASGVVTERIVRRAAAQGARLVLGPRAVITPLARDRARSLGLLIERDATGQTSSDHPTGERTH